MYSWVTVVCRRVHLWDQTKALPPSGQGTPECSPCKSSLVPSNQSSPVHRTCGFSNGPPVTFCLTAKDQQSCTGTPRQFIHDRSPSTVWKPMNEPKTTERLPRSSAHHGHVEGPEQHWGTADRHGGGGRDLSLAAAASSPAHMAPDSTCPRDAPKLLSPNQKTLVCS